MADLFKDDNEPSCSLKASSFRIRLGTVPKLENLCEARFFLKSGENYYKCRIPQPEVLNI